MRFNVVVRLASVLMAAVNKVVFACAYPQVRSDYMQQYASKVSDGMALQLGCLEIR